MNQSTDINKKRVNYCVLPEIKKVLHLIALELTWFYSSFVTRRSSEWHTILEEKEIINVKNSHLMIAE